MKTLDNTISFDSFSLTISIIGVFSLIGYVISFYQIASDKKKYPGHLFHLLILLMIPCMLNNIIFYLNLLYPEKCDYQATAVVFVDTSILIWNLILVIETYQFLSFQIKMKTRKLVIYCVIGYIIPIVSAVILLELNFYGNIHYVNWCWIDIQSMAWTYLSLLFLIYLFNIYIFFLAKKLYRENIVDVNQHNDNKKFYLIFRLIVSFIFGTTNRIFGLLLSENTHLDYISSVIFNSLGVFYFFIFFYNYRKLKGSQTGSLINSDLKYNYM